MLASWIGVTIGLTVFLLILIEGGASLVLFTYDVVGNQSQLAEENSTRYDPELGWVAEPNIDLPDFYGSGRGLRTESRGFRNNEDVTEEPTNGRARIICSGDSFTLGYGVDNDDTWCHLLSPLLNVETVNMGQGGYGVDQAYLWYVRDGLKLSHRIHLFAFIEEDFRRAQRWDFAGFPKPVLEVVDGELTVSNVPVPPDSWIRRVSRRLTAPSGEVRIARLLNGLWRRIVGDNVVSGERNAATIEMLAEMFDRLAKQNEGKSSRLVLVNLATKEMHLRVGKSYWQRSIGQLSDSLGITYIDLVPRLQELPGTAVERLFIQPDSVPYRGSEGHYTEAGNRWVANAVRAELLRIPELTGLLTTAGVGAP